MRDGLEGGELGDVVAAEVDVGALVADGVAVVRGGEDGDERAAVLDLVAVLSDLVGADEEGEAVVVEEAARDVGAEAEADAAPRGRG